MNILKTLCVSLVLTSLLTGLAPRPGVCQMPACAMSCCDRDAPGASCPMIQPASPQDMISTSFVKEIPAQHTAAISDSQNLFGPYNPPTQIFEGPAITGNFFCSTPQSIPAPPALA